MTASHPNLPAAQLIATGLADLERGVASVPALLVSIGAEARQALYPANDPAAFRRAAEAAFA